MAKNEYDNFKELEENEVGNYTIECIDRGSHITIIAPHGGCIEPRTRPIAKSLANETFNFYSFVGKKRPDCYGDLHITSTNFDEPKARELVGKSEIVIAIHGCSDSYAKSKDKKGIFIGGLDKSLIVKLQDALKGASLSVSFLNKFSGTNPNNICNRGARRKGVQFELTESFRKDTDLTDKFIMIVRIYLEEKLS